MKKQKSIYPLQGSFSNNWVVVDASGKVLGRLASEIAMIVRGKNKPIFDPSVFVGDRVVVVNVDRMVFTGKKLKDKKYYSHSGYPGGLKTKTLGQLFAQYPDRVLRFAVQGMLPKNRLDLIRHVRIYKGAQHPHIAQVKQSEVA